MSAIAPPTLQDRSPFALFRKIARASVPELWGVYEYSVFSASAANGIQATLTDPSQGVPSVVNIPIRPGIAGATTVPAAGSICYVAFANGDRSKPVAIAYDATESTSLILNPAGALGAARTTDAVASAYVVIHSPPAPMLAADVFPGTVAGLAAATTYAASLVPAGTVVPFLGSITGGSATVKVGA